MVVRELITLLGFQVEDEKLQKYERGISRATTGIAIAGAAVAALGTALIWSAGTMEQNEIAFEVMLGSAEKAKNMLKQLTDFAAKTPYQQADLIEGAKLMMNFGITAENIMPNLQMLGDVAMGNADKFKSLTLAFSQMTSTGRLQGQDLLQMINAGFNPLQVISKKTGESMASLKKKMEAGGISVEMVNQAFKDATSEGGTFYKMMDKQSTTFLGLLSTAKDNVMILATEIGKQLLPFAKDLLNEFSAWMEANKEIIKSKIVAFFTALAYAIGWVVVIVEKVIKELGGLGNIAGFVVSVIELMYDIILGTTKLLYRFRWIIFILTAAMLAYKLAMIVTAAVGWVSYLFMMKGFILVAAKATIAQWLLNASMMANPVGLVVAAIVALIAAGIALYMNWNEVSAWLIKTWKDIKDWVGFLPLVGPLIKLVGTIIENWAPLRDFFIGLWDSIVAGWDWVIAKIQAGIDWIADKVGSVKRFFGVSEVSTAASPGGATGTPATVTGAPGTLSTDQYGRTTQNQNNTNLDVKSNITVAVPSGTPADQADFVQKAAKNAVQEEWQSILKQTKVSTPTPFSPAAGVV